MEKDSGSDSEETEDEEEDIINDASIKNLESMSLVREVSVTFFFVLVTGSMLPF